MSCCAKTITKCGLLKLQASFSSEFSHSLKNYLYCAIGVIFFGIILALDTSMIIGKQAIKYNVDDYIYAVLNVYLDIIIIFTYALEVEETNYRFYINYYKS